MLFVGNMDLSIVIVSWNTREILAQCLSSIYRYPPAGTFDVWVVDNASTDDSVPMIKTDFPDVRLIENRENIGFAPANNQAIRASGGDYVLLLNPDTEVSAGTFDTLRDFLQVHPDVGAVGPKTLNPDGSLQTSCYPFPTLSRELWRLLHLDKIAPYGSYRMAEWAARPREVDALLGACILFPRKVLDEIGLFDENYFMYTEEIDLCYRARQSGKKLFWVPETSIVHYGGQSTRQAAAEMFLQLYKSKLQFFRKHYGVTAGWLYKLILFFTAVPRLLLIFGGSAHRAVVANYWRLITALPTL